MMLTRRRLAAGLMATSGIGFGFRRAAAQSVPASPTSFLGFSQVVELSGPRAREGDAWRNGVELAVQEINAAGGVLGQGLSMITLNIENGHAAVQRALEPPPLALLGPLGDAAARMAAPMARAANVACITGAEAPDLTGFGSVVRATPGLAVRAPRLAGWMAGQMNVHRVGIAWGTLEPGRTGHEFWVRALRTAGLDITMDQGIAPTATSIVGQVGAFARDSVEAVLLLLPPADALRFLREFRRQNLQKPVVGDSVLAAPRFVARAGQEVEGVRCQVDFLADPPAPGTASATAMAGFAARYRGAFKEEPDSPSVRGYTAVGLLAAGLDRLGRPDHAGLASALKGLRIKAGAPGMILDTAIEPSGEMTRPTFMIEIRSGKPALLATLG